MGEGGEIRKRSHTTNVVDGLESEAYCGLCFLIGQSVRLLKMN